MGFIKKLFNWKIATDKDDNKIRIGCVLDTAPKTIEDIQKGFKAFKLDKYLDEITPHIRPRIDLTLTPCEEDNLLSGQSKIGGLPDMADMNDWPNTEEGKPMSFIAQLNCKELSDFDVSGLIPKEGLISFFYCADQGAWGFDPNDKQRFKIVYTNHLDSLKKMQYPFGLEPASIFKPNEVKFDTTLSLPDWGNDFIRQIIEDEDYDNYMEVSSGTDNQIFGYANCVQGPMELECQLVTNGLYCGDASGYQSPKRKELEDGVNDWVLLLQIGSEEEKTGMTWGDAGRLYYWIKKQDLKQKRFDKSWFILQCH